MRFRTRAIVLIIACAAILLVRYVWIKSVGRPIADIPSPAASPAHSSPYLNTRPEVAYVGSGACVECHLALEDASYRQTGMGRSMAAIDLAAEPPDGTFDHLRSKRRYEVVRRDDQMWHRELTVSEAAEPVVLSEYPVKYVVGSGRHSPVVFYRGRRLSRRVADHLVHVHEVVGHVAGV